MFGYIYVNEQELKIREFSEYRRFYCGLCHSLHKKYGRMAQMMLNYDMTFLAILLNGLYEPDTQVQKHRCIPHPLRSHDMIQNDAVSYAADMSVLLSYQSLVDDWEDEKSVMKKGMSSLLKKSYREVSSKYPRQTKAIEENIRLLHLAEKENCRDIDYVAGLTGKFLSEVYQWKEDEWKNDLSVIGFFIGKFVYLIDALEDLEKDRKKGNYNIFSENESIWEQEEKIRMILSSMMMEAARAFERLPVLKNAEIIRNILYSGVWCKYVLIRKESGQEGSNGGAYEKSV